MKTTDHRMRVDTVRQQGGRSGGGKAQLLDARMRRARDKKDKFHQAREFVQRSSASQEQRAMAEARILRQRSKQLKSRRTPGLGFTPARFRLMPVENESGTELTALSCNDGGMLRTMSIKQLAEQVSAATFDNMGLAAPVAEAAKQILMMQYRARNAHVKTDPELKPTEIQALAIPEILGQTRVGGKSKPTKSRGARNVFLAAETGSGKTFAYALPLVSMLKQEEAVQKDMDLLRRERRPRALIVVPSRELVKQVTQTLKAIAHHAKVRVIGVHLGVSRRALRTYAEQGPIDIMVSTPGAVLCYMVRDPVFSPASVRRLVIDEADSLMDSHSFGQQTVEVLDLIRRANQTQTGQSEQAIFVSATLPKLIREQIILRYPDVVHVTTPSLHRAPQKLSQTFIDVSKDFQGHRLNALWYVLRTAAADKHAIIFCNNKENANMVFRQMRRRGHPSLLLTGATHTQQQQEGRPPTRGNNHRENEDGGPQQQQPVGGSSINDLRAPVPSFDRDEVLKAFANSDPVPEHLLAPVSVDPEVAQTQSAISTTDGGAPSRVRKILVCTDLASRGLDTTFVTHVVLFDFPTTAIDYLHRSGRTARAGGKGKVSALVGKKDRRLADQIRLAIRQGGVIS
ncbi:hypothetical protein IW140_003003 [Coemansia sp. RSA 1813]|nr:hypothetical protein EV178_001223 [Coemansia sp. RSA 1646]KAJ1772575.1 hypothetical protein LPJ74_001291 [Coemansia sp. RSA 1843]KAJ2091430.1 hypothetical protein IW138_001889 [Coemansia sp. RSA 986]KAJ2213905.1 hypothetical protein EV179_003489 [Coemansia sp. RSA 487]KAJ2569595.1 hypothetical protein IW140_003003 [Coemansia sp. RSA 1813]